ncbi:hypothetical protein M513_10794 [Trichuris suis]|uniref:Uncharacterized protein n=1 Tax=Trichuris suis TaxID=68888 RepID=A0A085LTK6_9BILA|nr:hypothetical protein M513_10794 [Trichuris suis]
MLRRFSDSSGPVINGNGEIKAEIISRQTLSCINALLYGGARFLFLELRSFRVTICTKASFPCFVCNQRYRTIKRLYNMKTYGPVKKNHDDITVMIKGQTSTYGM